MGIPSALIDPETGPTKPGLPMATRTDAQASGLLLELTGCAGVWVREGVLIVFIAAIEAGEVFLNQ